MPKSGPSKVYPNSGSEYRTKKYICKHCKVEVMSKTDLHARIGHEHQKNCPRRDKF